LISEPNQIPKKEILASFQDSFIVENDMTKDSALINLDDLPQTEDPLVSLQNINVFKNQQQSTIKFFGEESQSGLKVKTDRNDVCI
tara:strand:+ start:487 stop:744 length:258 start_codon:yes stop_codon:yes gene_type:complete